MRLCFPRGALHVEVKPQGELPRGQQARLINWTPCPINSAAFPAAIRAAFPAAICAAFPANGSWDKLLHYLVLAIAGQADRWTDRQTDR